MFELLWGVRRTTWQTQGVYSGVATVLVNGPPIGQHTFSSDLIGQKMLPVPVSTQERYVGRVTSGPNLLISYI